MSLFLSPVCNDQTFDANGDPLTGGQIETYINGSSTPLATFTDDSGSTPQSNPIILNSLGYPTLGPIWLTGGQSYKFVIKDALGVTLRTIDDISGVNDASVSQSEWVQSGFVPTYINATSFSVPGDQTTLLQVNRRVRTTNTSGFIYSTISNSVFAAGVTTVTLTNDSGSLDSGLSAVEYALLSATSSSVPAISATRFTMATSRILGRDTASTGPVEELTAAEVLALLGVSLTSLVPVGAVQAFFMSAAPSGWLRCSGTTIGSATSGATARANADTLSLYTILWNNSLNTVLTIQTSGGVNTTRGASAADDFAANKRMPLPNLDSEFIRGLGGSRDLGSLQLDAFQGHAHSPPSGFNFLASGGSSAGQGGTSYALIGGTGPADQNDGVNGTPRTASETRPRNVALLYCIKY